MILQTAAFLTFMFVGTDSVTLYNTLKKKVTKNYFGNWGATQDNK